MPSFSRASHDAFHARRMMGYDWHGRWRDGSFLGACRWLFPAPRHEFAPALIDGTMANVWGLRFHSI